MKTRYIALIALAIVLSACGKHDDGRKGDPVAAEFVCDIGGGVTARVSGEDGDTWDDGDRIGISGAGYTNIPFVNNGGKFREEGASVYFPDANTHTFNAYYPYNEAGGVLTVTTDTEAQRNQSSIDFLFATGAEGSVHSPIVKFTDGHAFRHCMSRIIFVFKSGNGIDFTQLKPEGYTLYDVILDGTFDTTDGIAVADGQAQAKELTMKLENGDLTSSVILFPQTTASMRLAVLFNDQRYTATLTIPDGGLKTGKSCLYTVKIKNNDVEISDATIEPWNNIDNGEVDATWQ